MISLCEVSTESLCLTTLIPALPNAAIKWPGRSLSLRYLSSGGDLGVLMQAQACTAPPPQLTHSLLWVSQGLHHPWGTPRSISSLLGSLSGSRHSTMQPSYRVEAAGLLPRSGHPFGRATIYCGHSSNGSRFKDSTIWPTLYREAERQSSLFSFANAISGA